MIYVLFVAIALVSTALAILLAARYGAADPGPKLKLFKPADESTVPFSGTKLVLITTVCVIASTVVQISLYKNTTVVNFVKLYVLFVIVMAAALIDARRHIIPNTLVLFGLVFRAGTYVYELLSRADLKAIAINDLIGLAVGFGILALVSLLSKGQVGFGDAKLFAVIGVTGGSFCTYSTLLVSLVISTAVSLVALARKKIDKKDAIPFGPSIALGYAVVLLLTSY